MQPVKSLNEVVVLSQRDFSGGIVGAKSVQPGQIASWNATGDGFEGGFPGISRCMLSRFLSH